MKKLTRKELKTISGSKAQNYIKVTCKTGGGSASSTNSTISIANQVGIANCGAGNYTIVCIGDC